MKLIEGIYFYPWLSLYENNCNTYLLSGEVLTLVDVGHLKHVPRLLTEIEMDRISLKDLSLIISTHLHPDHHEGVELLGRKDLLVAFHREEERHLREYGYQLYQGMGLSVPSRKPDFYLQEGELLLGEDRWQILHVPGHSPGSICLYSPQKKVLISGDVLFLRGVGRTDFYEGDSKALAEGIERLSRLDIEYLLPGHGEIIVGKRLVEQNFDWIKEQILPFL